MKKIFAATVLSLVALPGIALAGKYTQGTVYAAYFTQNGGAANSLDASYNNRYTADTTSFVTITGAPGGTLTISAASTPWVSSCSQCLYTFSCTIATTSSLYSTALDLMVSANVNVKIGTWRWAYTNAPSDCQSLSVSNSSSYIK